MKIATALDFERCFILLQELLLHVVFLTVDLDLDPGLVLGIGAHDLHGGAGIEAHDRRGLVGLGADVHLFAFRAGNGGRVGLEGSRRGLGRSIHARGGSGITARQGQGDELVLHIAGFAVLLDLVPLVVMLEDLDLRAVGSLEEDGVAGAGALADVDRLAVVTGNVGRVGAGLGGRSGRRNFVII